jgi:hypothetical protein
MIAILAVILAVDVFRRREKFHDLKTYFWTLIPAILWAGVSILSCLWTADFPSNGTGKVWAHGIFNPVLFGCIATWVFMDIRQNSVEARRLVLILFVSTGLATLLALKQYVGPVGLPYDSHFPDQALGGASNVRLAGWFEFRGIFGALMALILPAAVAFAILDKDGAVRVGAFALASIGLSVTLSAGGFIGAVAGILAVLAACLMDSRTRHAGLLGLVLLGIFATLVLPRLPRDNPKVIFNNLTLYANAEDPLDEEALPEPTARLRRYQAVLNVLASERKTVDMDSKSTRPNWITGVGVGRYQDSIKRFYQAPYSKPSRDTDDEASFDRTAHEPFTFGFLETVTVELGVIGLMIVLVMFAVWIGCGVSGFLSTATTLDSTERLLSLAALGAGSGALVLSIFANPAIRGVGGAFAFFLTLAVAYRAKSVEK